MICKKLLMADESQLWGRDFKGSAKANSSYGFWSLNETLDDTSSCYIAQNG